MIMIFSPEIILYAQKIRLINTLFDHVILINVKNSKFFKDILDYYTSYRIDKIII